MEKRQPEHQNLLLKKTEEMQGNKTRFKNASCKILNSL